jgi:membrane protein YdbS with pleckstrin-like domain
MTTEAITNCGNCDRTIGRLEPRFVWQSHTVCQECFTRLSGARPAPQMASEPAATPLATPPATQVHVPPVYAPQSANVVAPPPVSHATLTSATRPAGAAHPVNEIPAALDPHAEKIVFEGHPAILIYLGSLSLAAIVAILGLVGWIYFFKETAWYGSFMRWVCIAAMLGGLITFGVRYLQIEYIKYRLSNQRLFITTGILARKTVETELFRVRDISVHQSLIERMLGIGTIHALTTDKDIPEMNFRGIPEPLKVKEAMRAHIMEARQRTRTRDLDVADVDGNNTLL